MSRRRGSANSPRTNYVLQRHPGKDHDLQPEYQPEGDTRAVALAEHGHNQDVGFRLQAVIAREHVLRELAGHVPEARIVALGQHLSLLPMTDEYHDAIAISGAPKIDAFWRAPAGFAHALIACSATGSVAYVEAEYFGGTGTQAAQVWLAGKVTLGPLSHDGNEPFSATEPSPISQALRQLGAVAGGHFDEFGAVGLGRHRDTEDWLPISG